MNSLSSSQLRAALINADARERKTMTLPPGFPDLDWQDREVIAWMDRRARGRGYVVRWHAGAAEGLVLKAAPPPGLPSRAVMCTLCRVTQRFDEVALYTARRPGEAGARGNTVGSYICEDLRCYDRLRAPRRGTVEDLAAANAVEDRVRGYLGRLDALFCTVRGVSASGGRGRP